MELKQHGTLKLVANKATWWVTWNTRAKDHMTTCILPRFTDARMDGAETAMQPCRWFLWQLAGHSHLTQQFFLPCKKQVHRLGLRTTAARGARRWLPLAGARRCTRWG
jgi:hypothetical protein